jgi:hypothetical protein
MADPAHQPLTHIHIEGLEDLKFARGLKNITPALTKSRLRDEGRRVAAKGDPLIDACPCQMDRIS